MFEDLEEIVLIFHDAEIDLIFSGSDSDLVFIDIILIMGLTDTLDELILAIDDFKAIIFRYLHSLYYKIIDIISSNIIV